MKKKDYVFYDKIDKELLDTIETGDLIKINDWKKPSRVKGVSKNYFVMIEKLFDKTFYSVCEKKPFSGGNHNEMTTGLYHCSTDNKTFGYMSPNHEKNYDFDNKEWVHEYLECFENGELELSHRKGCPIEKIYIKKCK